MEDTGLFDLNFNLEANLSVELVGIDHNVVLDRINLKVEKEASMEVPLCGDILLRFDS